jgi:Tfp pilus assembly protein PilX
MKLLRHRLFSFPKNDRRGVALVLVLAFVVLLASIIVAFFSRVQSEQQISRASANQTKVKLLADGAVDTIVGDLKQEMAAGAADTNTFADGSVFYTITNSANMVPERTYSGATNTDYANLVSYSGTPMYSGATDRSTNVATTETNSTGRNISKDRWNKPLFLPDTAKNIFDQVKWVTVSRKGDNTATSSQANLSQSNSVIGRYAYVIYDEGGLLDINVAGYPDKLVGNDAMKRKIGLPYVNLTDLKDSAGGNLFTRNEAKTLTDWRDYATGQTVSAAPTPESAYAQSVFSNKTGFLQASNSALAGGESDRKFIGRQQLIDFVLNKLNSTGTKTALQYLTTFSRDWNQPSYVSAVQKDASAPKVLAANKGGNSAVGGDKSINPSFPTVRVQTSFTRNDGSTANVGEPLVSKRFSLQRLAWITYKGPSASRNQSDADIQALINNGIPWSYLQQGTEENIKKYFGLTWDGTNNRWKYDVYRGTAGSDRIIMLVGRPTGTGANAAIYVQDANREPNFFELLKAGITLGSLGKTAATLAYGNSAVPLTAIPRGYNFSQVPATLRYPLDSSVDYHIIQIGANILSEVNPTSFPVRIAFDDGSARGAWEFQGVTDLPYLQYVFNGVLIEQPPKPDPPGGTADNEPWQFPWSVNSAVTNTGNAYMIQVPAVWNPYDPNGTPGVLRPSQFRIVIDSNDPLHPPGSGDLQIWHGAVATQSTTGRGGPNTGLFFPNAVYSWTIGNGAKGKTTEHPTDPSIGTGNGTPIFDAVKFNDGNGALFREPTVIFKAQNAAAGNPTRVNALTNPTPGNALPAPGNITSSNTNPLPGETDNSTGPWAPLVLGQFPMAFSKDNTNQATCYTGTGLIGLATGNGDNRVYFTYRLQYEYPAGSNNWITYDTKYGRTTHGMFSFGGGPSPTVIRGPQRGSFNPYSWASAIDPRTARFGLITDVINIHHNQAWGKDAPPAWPGWIYNSSGAQAVATDGITYPVRKDNTSGSFLGNWDVNNLATGGRKGGNEAWSPPDTRDVPFPGYFDPANPSYSGWTAPVDYVYSNDVWMCAPGMYAQNNPGAPFYDGSCIQPCYYADADGVVRRAAGAYVPSRSGSSAITPVGLPPSSINGYNGAPQTPTTTPPSKGAGTNPANFAQSQSRPLLLHRPFRTVAELGYVFRDVPWKNLDFFTPESGDAALLDLFCINETSDPNGLVAGKVNLNTRQAPVLAAIISGAYVDDPKVTNATVGSLSPTVANSIATALTARTANTTANYGPLQNVAELIGKWNAAAACAPPSGTTYSPTNPGNSWGIDLPASNYKDGQKSYIGFSGNATGTTTGKDLSSVFTPTTPGTLMESMAYVQRFREAPIRALGNVGQTRVWNLMIDVVAQSGRYPQSATALDKFVVEGEQRYWVHVAIDRLTGQVIDKQIEVVKE